jgi:hypothetical protein
MFPNFNQKRWEQLLKKYNANEDCSMIVMKEILDLKDSRAIFLNP